MKFSYYRERMNKTKGRYDVAPLFSDYTLFNHLIKDLIKITKNLKFNKIAALDSLGYVIGSILAYKYKKGLVLIRKTGKIKAIEGTTIKGFFKDYTHTRKGFEITRSTIKKGDRILIIDEWMETGSKIRAAIKLIEELGGRIVGVRTIAMQKEKRSLDLFNKYDLNSIGLKDNTK